MIVVFSPIVILSYESFQGSVTNNEIDYKFIKRVTDTSGPLFVLLNIVDTQLIVTSTT